ncbi:replication initiation protein RepC [Chachezhania sediminis]|uniref:replication initiation protein RepC n=1 Tax=Chachezhania sediminis TaxID=2599291 RepID=UPI00131D62AA|nr:replication initiation protein RepC [Chachezhania sediminis]
MTQMSRIVRGQPAEACQTAGLPADKWALLDALTLVADRHGLNHRSLTVLRALLTFFPGRDLPADPGAGMVYPSNRTLSARLNGMPESTLRRHLAALVRSGLIARRDSANCKRFARVGGVVFGFDLSPLARAAASIAEMADDARAEAHRVAALRARLAAARQNALDDGRDPDDPLLEHVRLCLRRKLSSDVLRALVTAVETTLPDPRPCAPTVETSASDSRNERHIQATDKSISVRIQPVDKTLPKDPDISDVLSSCREYQNFFPTRHPDWPQLVSTADRLHPMMGIDAEVYRQASSVIGERGAAVSVLCMLESMAQIRSPGAYLRALCKRAEKGSFNLAGMLTTARRARLSADNCPVT